MSVEKVSIKSQDPWDAIRTIALIHSNDPLRTIEQMVDNSLDVQAHNVVVEIRKKGPHKSSPSITIRDDGEGWKLVDDLADPKFGLPDLRYTVEHIADSIKKKNEEFQRRYKAGLDVGQFGIGLLSFWGLGERMTIVTRSRKPDGSLSESARMVWIREEEKADIEVPYDDGPKASGTIVTIDRLFKNSLSWITGKIISDYLAQACRTHLMMTKAKLVVDADGKKYEVKPRRFEGRQIPIRNVEDMELEIFIPPPNLDRSVRRVSFFKVSEKVLDDVSQIPQLNTSPWNDGRVQGSINWPRGTLTPDRHDLQNDSEKGVFIDLMKKATKSVLDFIQEEERREKSLRTQETARLLKETWESIFRNLPEAWRRREDKGGLPPQPPIGPRPVQGPLDHVGIAPNDGAMQINSDLKLKAIPKDAKDNLITRNLLYSWELIGPGQSKARFLDSIGREVTLVSGSRRGIVTVHVSAVENGNVKKITSNVYVVEHLPPPPPPPPPPPGDRPPATDWVPDEFGDWRSRFQKSLNTVEINSLHSDYKIALGAGKAAELRYENMCIAREVALDRWKDVTRDPHQLSERIIELQLIADRAFGFVMPELPKKRGRPAKKASPSEK